MQTNLVTIEELEDFKQSMLEEIRKMLAEFKGVSNQKWLKTHELRQMLKLSQGSLQNLRLNGMLPFVRLGGIIYYSLDDVNAMLAKQKEVGSRSPFSLEKRSDRKRSR